MKIRRERKPRWTEESDRQIVRIDSSLLRRAKKKIFPISILLLLIMMYLLASPYSIADGLSPWLDADNGLLTHNGLRILQGEVLYREVWTIYGPASDYFTAFLYKVFGDNLRTLRLTLAFTGAATAFLIFHFSRTLTTNSFALPIVGLALLLGPISVNYPYPSWFCIMLGLCMILVEHAGWSHRRMVFYLVAGMIGGAIFSFKESWGVFALAALLCTESFEELLGRKIPSRFSVTGAKATVVLGFLWVSIFGVSLLLIRRHFSFANATFFSLPSLLVVMVGTHFLVLRSREGDGARVSLLPMICSLLGFAIIVMPWVVYFLVRLGANGFYESLIYPMKSYAAKWYNPPPAPTLTAFQLLALSYCQGAMILSGRRSVLIRLIFLLLLCTFGFSLAYDMFHLIKEGVLTPYVGEYNDWGFALICYIPLAVHIGIAFILMKDSLNPTTNDQTGLHLLVSLWIYSIAALNTLYPFMEVRHFLWCMAPVIVLGGVFIFRSLSFWGTTPREGRSAFRRKTIKACLASILPAYLALFLGLPIFAFFVKVNASPFHIRLAEFSRIDSPRGGVLMPKDLSADLNSTIHFITARTDPKEFIFDMTGSFFYFLADRRSPIKWGHFYAGFLSERDIQEIERRLDNLKPSIIVTSTAGDVRLSTAYPELYRFIKNRYKPLENFGRYRILSLCGQDNAKDDGVEKIQQIEPALQGGCYGAIFEDKASTIHTVQP